MNVGVIGTGAMGGGIASHLLDTGHQVLVRDIVSEREAPYLERGAQRAPDAATMIEKAATVFIVVVTAGQVDDVLQGPNGLLAGLKRLAPDQARTVLLCSTIAPQDTERLAGQLQAAGAGVLDAPISGGPARAADGTMSMMIAGLDSVAALCMPLLETVSGVRFRISSRVGDAARAKLVNNLAAGINLVAAAEALALAGNLGLDITMMQKLMAASSGQSWIADDRVPRALAGDFEPRAATRVLTKDLTLATQVATDAGVQVSLGDQALCRFRDACEAGFAEDDDAAMVRYLQDLGPGSQSR